MFLLTPHRLHRHNGYRKGAEFLCKVRWKNPLPPLPFAPKLLRYEINEKKYTQFQWSDWMKRQTFPLLTENDLGMALDLVDLDGFQFAPQDAIEMAEGELFDGILRLVIVIISM